jgi:hypothetical protein
MNLDQRTEMNLDQPMETNSDCCSVHHSVMNWENQMVLH